MAREHYPRLPEEEQLGINQITDPDRARWSAQIEKPIRDLTRDPKASPDVKALKSVLDKEADRLAADETRIKEELLRQPISVIQLSSTKRTNTFQTAAAGLLDMGVAT